MVTFLFCHSDARTVHINSIEMGCTALLWSLGSLDCYYRLSIHFNDFTDKPSPKTQRQVMMAEVWCSPECRGVRVPVYRRISKFSQAPLLSRHPSTRLTPLTQRLVMMTADSYNPYCWAFRAPCILVINDFKKGGRFKTVNIIRTKSYNNNIVLNVDHTWASWNSTESIWTSFRYSLSSLETGLRRMIYPAGLSHGSIAS